MTEKKKQIKLNKQFYSRDSVMSARKKFRDFVDLEIIEDETHYNIILNKDCSDDDLLNEFANHCLAESK